MDVKPNEGKITKQILKTRSGEFDIESIHSLILRGMDISDLGCIGECTCLERLDLSTNDVTKLYALAGLDSLSYLNLSANRIISLEGLQALDNLISLNLAGNLIGSVNDLRCISGLEKLIELRLNDPVKGLSNPMCLSHTYKQDVINMFPKLTVLDGERLSGKGSELFKMCSELDALIAAKEASGGLGNIAVPSPWTTEDTFHHHRVEEFKNSSMGDAEKQLQDLLADCKRVVKRADYIIEDEMSKLHSTNNTQDKS